ncbi:MAG: carotenoid oxygenase family protein [Deltaproteobacteria bacterium]|nr:carotenoid oxygenase family protein [Deltaproteobacteria bacterium]
MRESELNPFLQGNFAPWRLEGTADDLQVSGEIPLELNGTFYRNGPNPAYEPIGRYHWFDGDGMIHAITLGDGRASYRNRWVRSAGMLEERKAGKALYKGLLEMSVTEAPVFKNTGNTNIVSHAGKLLALMEAALPTQLRHCTLETLGEFDFEGKLTTAMTAHPKIDPESGELLFFASSPVPPYLVYHVANRDGELVRSEPIDLEWPSMIHDFAITKDYVVFILCPLVFSFEALATTGSAFVWEPQRGTRLGVMPRNGGNGDVRWFETDACYIFHPMNAYSEGRHVVLDVARFPRLLLMARDQAPGSGQDFIDDAPKLHRFRLDLRDGNVKSEPQDDRRCEFPRIDERLLGRKHRFGYVASGGSETARRDVPELTAVTKYDLETGKPTVREFGAGNGVGEPLFVPRYGQAEEDDGYVLVLAYDRAKNSSDFYILDARNIAAQPIAVVHIPNRVPYGFHGNWVTAS